MCTRPGPPQGAQQGRGLRGRAVSAVSAPCTFQPGPRPRVLSPPSWSSVGVPLCAEMNPGGPRAAFCLQGQPKPGLPSCTDQVAQVQEIRISTATVRYQHLPQPPAPPPACQSSEGVGPHPLVTEASGTHGGRGPPSPAAAATVPLLTSLSSHFSPADRVSCKRVCRSSVQLGAP